MRILDHSSREISFSFAWSCSLWQDQSSLAHLSFSGWYALTISREIVSLVCVSLPSHAQAQPDLCSGKGCYFGMRIYPGLLCALDLWYAMRIPLIARILSLWSLHDHRSFVSGMHFGMHHLFDLSSGKIFQSSHFIKMLLRWHLSELDHLNDDLRAPFVLDLSLGQCLGTL